LLFIAGLGNPGRKYCNTRHNVGFDAADELAEAHGIKIAKKKFCALTGEGMINTMRIILVKPVAYMNLSGEPVCSLLKYYRIPPTDMIVVYDDVNLPAGDIRVRKNGSAGGHNGMKDIIRCVKTEEFIRVRIGIGMKPPEHDLADYVLSKLKGADAAAVREGVLKAADAIRLIITEGADCAMNRFNKRLKPAEKIGDE